MSDGSLPGPDAGIRREGAPRRCWLGPVLAALAIALAVIAHVNTLGHPFVWDDAQEVQANTSIEDLSRPLTIARHYPTRPVVNFSYALDYRIWGGRDEFGFHLTNLVLHLIDVGLLFGFTYVVVNDLGRARGRPNEVAADATAFGASALLAVHPMMTEAVGYVSSRSELLCGAFMLAGLLCFRESFDAQLARAGQTSNADPPGSPGTARRPGSGQWRWLAGGLLCFGLALGSKEIAAMLPFVLVLYDVLLHSDPPPLKRSRFWRLHLPLMTLVAVGGIGRVWVFLAIEHPSAGRAAGHVVLAQAHTMVRYLALFLFPAQQTIVPVVSPILSLRDARVFEGLAGLTLALIAVIVTRRRAPLASFGLAFFFLLLVPSSALKVLSEFGQMMAEHRTYVASFGLFMAAGTGLSSLVGFTGQTRPGRRRAALSAAAFAAVLVAPDGAVHLAQSGLGRSGHPVDGCRRQGAADVAPATGTCGGDRQAGECQAAMEPYRHAIELLPGKAESYLGLAWCLLELRRVPEAAETLRLGMTRAPDNAQIPLQLAVIEERYFRDPTEALRLCQGALALAPDLTGLAQECVRTESAGTLELDADNRP